MVEWITYFRTLNPMANFPSMQVISVESRDEAGYHYEGRERRHETHCLFKYTLSGRGAFSYSGKRYDVTPGTGFLCEIRDGQMAYYYPEDATEPWRFVYVTFYGRHVSSMVGDMTSRFGHIYKISPDSELISRLLGYKGRDGHDIAISAAQSARFVNFVLTELAAASETPAAQDRSAQLVRNALGVIRRNMHRNLSVTELAAELAVSREHLARVFQHQTSQSPRVYIMRQKILTACRMLMETKLSNKEIAAQTGFSESGHFSRSFKAVMKQTPSEFRAGGIMPTSL